MNVNWINAYIYFVCGFSRINDRFLVKEKFISIVTYHNKWQMSSWYIFLVDDANLEVKLTKKIWKSKVWCRKQEKVQVLPGDFMQRTLA